MPMVDGDLRDFRFRPLPDDAPVADTAALAAVLGKTPGSAVGHLLAACSAGGWPYVEALRPVFPDVVAAWEHWRKHPGATAGEIRAALRRTPVRPAR